jgi:hypothetical protein
MAWGRALLRDRAGLLTGAPEWLRCGVEATTVK